MRKYGVIIAICLLVVVNAVVLGGIAYNRSGEPAATTTLTERELPFSSYYDYSDRENTGLSLRLNWSRDGFTAPLISFSKLKEKGNPDWFDKAKLEAIGFNCSMPLADSRAENYYQKMLPRKTYAVLEFEGSAWESWLAQERADLHEQEMQLEQGSITQKQLELAREAYERRFRTHTHLFIIDVANDPNLLRTKYDKQGRYMILPATVRLRYTYNDTIKEPPHLSGVISDILTDTIYVPKEHRAILEKILRERAGKRRMDNDNRDYGDHEPAYEVTLRVGKRAEPWIAGVRELVAAKSK